MKLRSRLLLRSFWRAAGQLRQSSADEPKVFDGGSIAPFRNAARAVASITADFELCWAWRNLTEAGREKRGAVERANVPLILGILEESRIPITWATVGHMFLNACQRGSCGRPHPEMPRPPAAAWPTGDWYAGDPCSSLAQAPGWYGPDLIRSIQASSVNHELGSHSFSHIDFSEAASTPELVEREMQACIEAMAPFGVKPRSLVFCFNHMGFHHLKLLHRLGITAVRDRNPRFRLALPERTASGVYRICESMNLRLAQKYDYADKARVFVDEAIRCGSSYHLWFHPSDRPEVFTDGFAPIVRYLAEKQAEGLLWVATMADLVAYREARRTTSVETHRGEQATRLKVVSSYDARQYGDTEITLCVESSRRPASIVWIRDGQTEVLPAQKHHFEATRQRAVMNIPCQDGSLELRYARS